MTAALVVGVVAMGLSCGRSAVPEVACPALADDCDGLARQAAALEAAYQDAVAGSSDEAAVEATAAARAEAGQCRQLIADAQLDGACIEVCPELCRLHPCGVLDADGARQDPGACADRCAELDDAGAFAPTDLETAVVKAAEDPGFCTCRACTSADDALCTQLFDCEVGS